MISVRNTLLIYFGLWLVCAALAAGGTIWLGLDGRVPVEMLADGTVTKSRSVAMLWFMPAIVAVMYGSLAIAALVQARRWRGRTVHLSEDAQRALTVFGRTFRIYMIGFGVLGILLQVFVLSRAGGIVTPLGLGPEGMVRAFNVLAGLLFAYAGNVTPKLPYVENAGVDAARHHRANRFAGWVFVVGGLAYSLIALILPFAQLTRVSGYLIAAMILLPLARYVWARVAYRRQKRWEEREGLV